MRIPATTPISSTASTPRSPRCCCEGSAYVGNAGAAVVDFTALGDTVNVAARLQVEAAAGQLVVADGVHEDIAGMLPGAERCTIDVQGRQVPVPVLIVDV